MSIIITTVVLFIVITIKTLNSRKQIGILKAIGVDKEVIMHNYGFQVIILAVLGIILGVIITLLLAAYMAVHPVVTAGMVGHPLPDTHGSCRKLPDPLCRSDRCRVRPGLPGVARGYPDRNEGLKR